MVDRHEARGPISLFDRKFAPDLTLVGQEILPIVTDSGAISAGKIEDACMLDAIGEVSNGAGRPRQNDSQLREPTFDQSWHVEVSLTR